MIRCTKDSNLMLELFLTDVSGSLYLSMESTVYGKSSLFSRRIVLSSLAFGYNTVTIPIGECDINSITLLPAVGSGMYTALWARCSILTNPASTTSPSFVAFSGYLAADRGIGYPLIDNFPTPLTDYPTKIVTDTAVAGATYTYTVPASTILRIKNIHFTFETSLVAATRYLQVQYLDVLANVQFLIRNLQSVIAGRTCHFSAGINYPYTMPPGDNYCNTFPLPDIIMRTGFKLVISFINIDVDDWIRYITMTCDHWVKPV